MELTGKIIAALPVREGTTQDGRSWKMATYVLETIEQYPKKMAFDVSDGMAGRIERLNITPGKRYTVYFDIDARTTQDGRWFNTIRAYDAREVSE